MQSTFRIPADMSGACRIDDCYKDKSKKDKTKDPVKSGLRNDF